MQFSRKFIAFIDVLGFTKMVEAAESDPAIAGKIAEILEIIGDRKALEIFAKSGPTTCPGSIHMSRDLNFKISQISDCVVVSAEPSPAGIINLMQHCSSAAFRLMRKGVLSRGFLTVGNIFHEENQFIGTGYMRAYGNEREVKFLSADESERGTPFIQLEQEVVDYVESNTDRCVKTMLRRMTRGDGIYTAIYPFTALAGIPSALVTHDFDHRKWKKNLETSIGYIMDTLQLFEDAEKEQADPGVKSKIQHYKRGLEEVIQVQLAKGVQLDRMIQTGVIPYGSSWGHSY